MGWPVCVRVGAGDDGRGCVGVIAVDVDVSCVDVDVVLIGEDDNIDR